MPDFRVAGCAAAGPASGVRGCAPLIFALDAFPRGVIPGKASSLVANEGICVERTTGEAVPADELSCCVPGAGVRGGIVSRLSESSPSGG